MWTEALHDELIRMAPDDLGPFIEIEMWHMAQRMGESRSRFEVHISNRGAWFHDKDRTVTGEMTWLSVPGGSLLRIMTQSLDEWAVLRDSWDLLRREFEKVGAVDTIGSSEPKK